MASEEGVPRGKAVTNIVMYNRYTLCGMHVSAVPDLWLASY